MTAFILVVIAFFIFTDIPMSIALVFGAIALATAPAPSLSIVKEYNAKGPVSKTLIPLAALNDVLGLIVFFLLLERFVVINEIIAVFLAKQSFKMAGEIKV